MVSNNYLSAYVQLKMMDAILRMVSAGMLIFHNMLNAGISSPYPGQYSLFFIWSV